MSLWRSVSSPYINRFLQPDSIIPDQTNLQSWNRYSYVLNNPIAYNDPTGHNEDCQIGLGCADNTRALTPPVDPPGGGGEGNNNCNGDDLCRHHNNDDVSLLDSEVYLIFGHPGTGNNTIGYASGDNVCSSGGIGTVVGNASTIITAHHVYAACAMTQNTLWIQVDGVLISYSISGVVPVQGEGDIVTIALPSNLPSNVVPATQITNHNIVSGEPVEVISHYRLYNSNGEFTGVVMFSSPTTIMNDWRVRTPYGQQVMLTKTLIAGSSGGGVFSNGQLIGVNSFADFVGGGGTTMASLCRNWLGLVC